MATIKNIIDEVIFENKEITLKLFYDVDVFIQEFKDKTPEEETPEEEETPQEESVTNTKESLNEDIVKQKVSGELTVPNKDIMNIQTIQDLIEYMSDKKHSVSGGNTIKKIVGTPDKKTKGKIISPIIQEVILLLSGMSDSNPLNDIVDKGDKVIIEIQYGVSKQDSIGLKINKASGTDVVSIMMMKNNEVLPGEFNPTLVNTQILYYRNSSIK